MEIQDANGRVIDERFNVLDAGPPDWSSSTARIWLEEPGTYRARVELGEARVGCEFEFEACRDGNDVRVNLSE